MITLICLFVAMEGLLASAAGWQDKWLLGHDERDNDSRSFQPPAF